MQFDRILFHLGQIASVQKYFEEAKSLMGEIYEGIDQKIEP